MKDGTTTTRNAIFNSVTQELENSVAHYDQYTFLNWKSNDYGPDEKLITETVQGGEPKLNYQIGPMIIEAVYAEQPIEITCTYKNHDGSAATVTGQALKAQGSDIYTAFEAFLVENNIPTAGVKGWAFDPRDAFEPDGNKMKVAAIYGNCTPVYVEGAYMAWDEAGKELYLTDLSNKPGVIYVDMDYPADGVGGQSEDGNAAVDPFDHAYSKAVIGDENPGGKMATIIGKTTGEGDKQLTLDRYEPIHVELLPETEALVHDNRDPSNSSAGFYYRSGAFYGINAVYNKVYVEILQEDGTVLHVLADPDKGFTVPGSPYVLWDKEIPGMGGTAIPGGSVVALESPYTKLSAFTLRISALDQVPGNLPPAFDNVSKIRDSMDNTALDEKKFWHKDKLRVEYYDVKLLKNVIGQGLVEVRNGDQSFPAVGIWIMLDYPEGTDINTDFVVTHMFTDGARDGTSGNVEIIKGDRLIKTDRGIKVKVYSLSPIAVAHNDGANAGGGVPGTSAGGTGPGAGEAGSTGAGMSGTTLAATGDDTDLPPMDPAGLHSTDGRCRDTVRAKKGIAIA